MSGAATGVTSGTAARRGHLDAAQRRVLGRLVGEEIARQDEPAVAEAYADFRAAMEGLSREFASPPPMSEAGRRAADLPQRSKERR